MPNSAPPDRRFWIKLKTLSGVSLSPVGGDKVKQDDPGQKGGAGLGVNSLVRQNGHHGGQIENQKGQRKSPFPKVFRDFKYGHNERF